MPGLKPIRVSKRGPRCNDNSQYDFVFFLLMTLHRYISCYSWLSIFIKKSTVVSRFGVLNGFLNSDVPLALHRKLSTTPLFVQHLVQTNTKGNMKAPHNRPFVAIRRSPVESPHKGPVIRCVHVITPSSRTDFHHYHGAHMTFDLCLLQYTQTPYLMTPIYTHNHTI